MTYRELLAIQSPEKVGCGWGGCMGCPSDIGMPHAQRLCMTQDSTESTCAKCWETEIGREPLESAAVDATADAHDDVNHPGHYTSGSVECIDAIDSAVAALTGYEAVYIAQVMKYIWRYRMKNGVEDLKKVKWYLTRLIQKLEAGQE